MFRQETYPILFNQAEDPTMKELAEGRSIGLISTRRHIAGNDKSSSTSHLIFKSKCTKVVELEISFKVCLTQFQDHNA